MDSELLQLSNTDFFSLIEFPSQFSTLVRSFVERPFHRSGATASANPVLSSTQPQHFTKKHSVGLTKRAHFNHSLVIITREAPILWTLGIGSSSDALNPPLREAILAASRQQTCQAP